MKNKKISIIVIANNNIDKCIQNLKRQSYIRNMEIILLSSKEIIEKVEDKELNIKHIESEKNIFESLNKNKSIITGDYITILNSEDNITVDYYRTMITTAVKEKADIVMSNSILQYKDGGRAYLNLSEASLKELEKERILDEYLKQEGFSFLWSIYGNKIFERELFEKTINDINKKDNDIQNFYFFTIMFYYSKKIVPVFNEVLFYNFEEDNSECIRKFVKENKIKEKCLYENVINNFKYIEEFMEDKNIRINTTNWMNFYLSEDKKIKKDIITKIKTAWNDNLEKIKEEILHEKTKVVSFDIFDTLVVRPFWNPIDLFTFMNEKFRKINNTEIGIDFSKIRVETEKNIRKKLNDSKNQKQDITLDEIYNEIKNEMNIEDKVIEEMKKIEQELEIRFCTERRIGKELYELAKYLDKKIVCTSDMYLSLETIKKILIKNEYEINTVYLSSEIELTKFNGDLYKFVISDLSQKSDEIVHIGDNYYSDYQNARKYGINAQFLPKAIDVFCNEKITNALGKLFKNNISLWENNANGLNFLGIRSMLAIVANKYFDNPYRTFNNESDFNADPNLIGYYVLGMHLFGVTDWLLKNSMKENYDKIVFFARDGYWIMRAYQLLKKIYPYAPREEYLYISRRALVPVTLNDKFDFYKLSELIDIYKYTPKTILKYIKDILMNLENLELECSKEGIDINKKFENKTEFNIYMNLIIKKFYDQNRHKEIVRKLKKYFDEMFRGKSCSFDIGYSAKPEMYLSLLCQKPIDTYFINISNEEALEHSKIGNFKLYTYFEYTPAITGVIRESLMSISDPSCIGYEFDIDEKVIPIFDEEENKYQNRFIFDSMQNKAIEFIKDLIGIFENNIEKLYYQKYYVSLPHEMYINSAKKIDQEIFYGIELEDSIGIGKEITAIEEWDNEMNKKKQKRTEELFDINLINDMKNEIKSLNKRIKETEEEKQELIKKYQSKDEEVNNIYNSKRWKYIEKINKLLRRKK